MSFFSRFQKQSKHDPFQLNPQAIAFRWIEASALFVFCLLLFFTILSVFNQWMAPQICVFRPSACAIGKLGLTQLLAFGISTALGILIFGTRQKITHQLFLHRISFPLFLACMVLGVGLQLTLAELINIFQEVWPISLDDKLRVYQWVHHEDSMTWALALFSLVVIAPLSEEFFFRGFVLTRMNQTYSSIFSIVFTSIIFGLAHGELPLVLSAFFAGIFLSWVALYTKSTLAPIVAHVSTNATPFILSEKMIAIEGFNTLSSTHTHMPWYYCALGAFLTLAALPLIVKSSPNERTHSAEPT